MIELLVEKMPNDVADQIVEVVNRCGKGDYFHIHQLKLVCFGCSKESSH